MLVGLLAFATFLLGLRLGIALGYRAERKRTLAARELAQR
jgi:hypothetical protein